MVEARSRLCDLTIRNLGVIESAEVNFGPGLTVLTGETGAGKTMVLTALNLILGNRSDSDLVRTGTDRLQVTGNFSVSGSVKNLVEEIGGVVEDGELLISRFVNSDGKSKATLGGAPSTLNALAHLGGDLIEIHAQSSSARLAKANIQRDLLDSFGEYSNLIEEYQSVFKEHVALLERIESLRRQLSERDKEVSRLEAFSKDFNAVNPVTRELLEIENEISRLGSVEAINSALSLAIAALVEDESSAINGLQAARKSLESLFGKDSHLDSYIEKFREVIMDFDELSSDLGRYLAKLEADPKRFDYLQERRSAIVSLIKKYGVGSDREQAFEGLLKEAERVQEVLSDLQGGDDRLLDLEQQAKRNFESLKNIAKSLFEAREKCAKSISSSVTNELAALSMPKASFVVEVRNLGGDKFSDYTVYGCDEIAFLFTSHQDGKLLPIGKAASGGELSRVMLALEVVLAKNSKIGTYIFDEVDAGVGGKAAIEVGRRLAKLAKDSQVIVVTHLPQVAVWADQHLVVEKSDSGSVTVSDVKLVSGAGRIKEIARLLSGQDESKSAHEHAEELLEMVANSR